MAGGACSAKAAATTAVRRCWSSKFPDDLLVVICRMLESPRGRARFIAVCRSWRAAARTAPRVALPWLLLSPWNNDTTRRVYCPEDGSVIHVPLPGKAELVGCHGGGWVATFMPASLKIVNISSGAKVKLGRKQERLVCGNHVHDSILKFAVFPKILKVVFSEPPTSPSCILAAIIHHDSTGHCVGLCRIGFPNSGWTIQRCRKFLDITFYNNNELYGLNENGSDLVKFEIGMNEDGAPVVVARRHLTMKSIGGGSIPVNSSELHDMSYIFELHGKLAMARRAQWSLNIEPFFKVFELVELTACYEHKWVEVTDLGDHALFLGRIFSTAVLMEANRHGGVERNNIYFFYHRSYSRDAFHQEKKVCYELYGGQTYYNNRKNNIAGDEVKRIGSVQYFTATNHNGGAWVLPSDI